MKIDRLSPHLLLNILTLIVVGFMLFAYNAWAAPSAQESLPGVISYQGTLTDSAGQPVSGDVEMTFRLYDAPTGGTALWTEAHAETNAVPIQDGLFHVLLGSLNPIPSTVWTNDQLYIGIQVGSEPEMEPREQLGAVPFATKSQIASVADIASSGVNGFSVGNDPDLTQLYDGAINLQSERDASGFATAIRMTDTSNGYRWLMTQKYNGLAFLTYDPAVGWRTKMSLSKDGDLWIKGSMSNGAIIENNLQSPEKGAQSPLTGLTQGDLLCWDKETNQLERCVTQASLLVVAVADKQGKPIVLGAEPVKVLGPVEPGDLLVASDVPGYAVAWPQVGAGSPPVGVVIAKALETFEGKRGLIKAMILGR